MTIGNGWIIDNCEIDDFGNNAKFFKFKMKHPEYREKDCAFSLNWDGKYLTDFINTFEKMLRELESSERVLHREERRQDMKVFFHNADFDGICSAAIVKYKFPECELHGINYGDDFPFGIISKDDIVYMVDFSLQPFPLMGRLSRNCKELIWIDHHQTAIEEEGKFSTNQIIPGIRQNGKAACELTWEFLFPDKEMPYAVKLLGRYDVRDLDAFSDNAVLNFQYGMRLVNDLSPETLLWIDLFTENVTQFVIRDGKTILQYVDIDNAKYAKRYAYEVEFEGLRAIVINKGNSNSKLFDSVYDKSKHDLMIAISLLPGSSWAVSLYSTKPEVDCGEIARRIREGVHVSNVLIPPHLVFNQTKRTNSD